MVLTRNKTKETNIEYILGDGTSVRLPYIGRDVRIFDFDRACKMPKHKAPEQILLPDDTFEEFNQICDYNTKADTYKILCSIYNRTQSHNLRKFIKTCFPTKSLLTHGTINHRVYNKPFDDGFGKPERYYQLSGKPLDKHMLSTAQILKLLAKKVHNPMGEIIQTYSLSPLSPERPRSRSRSRSRSVSLSKRSLSKRSLSKRSRLVSRVKKIIYKGKKTITRK
jgi:hypothetical protein